MLSGVTALLERSLRIDARAVYPHLCRFGLISMIYVAMILMIGIFAGFGAPGLQFFRIMTYMNIGFITLLGTSYFATSITEEKEEDTLGLMLMAGISPLGILLGKSGGRLVQSLLLVAVQYPFMLLAITLGGITHEQIRATYAALLAYTLMLSGIGLFYSTTLPRGQTASGALFVSIVAYIVVPLSCYFYSNAPGVSSNAFTTTILSWSADSCVFLETANVLTTGFNEPLLSRQVITNSLIGCLGYFISWACFHAGLCESSSEAQSRGLMTSQKHRHRLFSPGRPGDLTGPSFHSFRFQFGRQGHEQPITAICNPIAWKDYYFVAGGLPAVLFRLLFIPSFYLVLRVFIRSSFGPSIGSLDSELEMTAWMYATIMLILISIDAAVLVSRSLQMEIRSQTLAPLLLLPISSERILYAKYAGIARCWLLGATGFFLMIWLIPFGMKFMTDAFLTNLEDTCVSIWMVSHLFLVPHLAAVYAMVLRWGMVSAAIATTVTGFFVEVTLLVSRVPRPSTGAGLILLLLCSLNLSICFACHIAVLLRIRSIGMR